MHILEIPSFFKPYGGEFCLDQAKALDRQEHDVRILSHVQLGITLGLKDYLTLPYRPYRHTLEGISVRQSFQRGIPMAVHWNANRWIDTVRRGFDAYVETYGEPDVLHAHCAKWAGYAAMLISRDYGIPYVITEHLSLMSLQEEFGPAPEGAWQIPLLREAYHLAAMVVPVAKEIVEETACYYGKDYRWQELSNVIDTDFFRYQHRQPLLGRKFVFACVARYDFRKGYDVLAEAFRELHRRLPDTELRIAGAGTDSSACRKLMAMEGVTLMGALDKTGVRRLLYEADALVLPSRSEVQPLVVLEAMSTGIPVVATACVPQNERLEGACSIVPTDDAKALAEAMHALVLGYDGYDGRKVADQVRELASPDVVGRKLSELLTQAKG